MSATTTPTTVGVGIIGAGWMGHVHARAYSRVGQHFPSLSVRPKVVAVADSVPAQLEDFVARHGEMSTYSDWRDVIADPAVQIVSVTAPNFMHAEIGAAVADAGKHLWIEKPVGLTLADAQAVADAVKRAGVVGCVGFNYRNVPAVAKAAELIASGAIGRPTHARVVLFTDYAANPAGPLSWRYEIAQGGHGVLGDLASHAIDMTRFLLGDLDELVADTAIFIPKRPIVDAGSSHYATVDLDDPNIVMGEVENEDFVSALMRTTSGVLVSMESDRAAVGEQNAYGFEVHGTQGLVKWDFRRPGELHVSTGTEYSSQPTVIAFSAPGDGRYGAFQPGAGIVMGYDDTKVIEADTLLRAIYEGATDLATLDDAVHSAAALDAIVESARDRRWVSAAPR